MTSIINAEANTAVVRDSSLERHGSWMARIALYVLCAVIGAISQLPAAFSMIEPDQVAQTDSWYAGRGEDGNENKSDLQARQALPATSATYPIQLPVLLVSVEQSNEKREGTQIPETTASASEKEASPAPIASTVKDHGFLNTPFRLGHLVVGFDIQAASLATRYRVIESSAGEIIANQLQYSEAFKGRLYFGQKRIYSINVGIATGNTFIGGWNATGWGTGDFQSNLYLKQLYFEAKFPPGIEVQYGGLAFNRGESTEITSYDNDAYLMGERLTIKRAGTFFFDEITATYAYLGDLTTPGFVSRYDRLKESNYHQFLVSKKIGSRGSFSADYTFYAGSETFRQAIKLKVAESRFLDNVLFENYERTDVKPDYGFALSVEKMLRKRFTAGGGIASIDRNYGGFNGDRYSRGTRLFGSIKATLSPEFSATAFCTRTVAMDYAVLNRTRLELIFTFDMLKALKRTGLL